MSEDENNKSKMRGKTLGAVNKKFYLWKFAVTDPDGVVTEGKFRTIAEANEELGLSLNSDYVKRIRTHYRVDTNRPITPNSFLGRWGHIQIAKIRELAPQEPKPPKQKVYDAILLLS
jgi:hypothetical protein